MLVHPLIIHLRFPLSVNDIEAAAIVCKIGRLLGKTLWWGECDSVVIDKEPRSIWNSLLFILLNTKNTEKNISTTLVTP